MLLTIPGATPGVLQMCKYRSSYRMIIVCATRIVTRFGDGVHPVFWHAECCTTRETIDRLDQRRAVSTRVATSHPVPLPSGNPYSVHALPVLYELYSNNPQCTGDRVRPMEYARLETGTLKDVSDEYYFGCSCQSCLHTARLSLSKLRTHLGADFPLRNIRERLKCQICSSRKVTITFLGPHQKGGNLHYLFQKESR
jgi:hypothetical protein